MYFPDLTTDRLLLRGVSEEDAGFFLRQFSDQDVCRYLYDAEPYTSLDEAEELVGFFIDPEGKNRNRWVIVEKASGEPIGTCGYSRWDRDNNLADLGYDLGRPYWGRGYMTEALTAALTSGFDNMALHRVEAVIALENVASYSLVEKLGFHREGIMRERHLFRGTYYDHYLYSLLAQEWRA